MLWLDVFLFLVLVLAVVLLNPLLFVPMLFWCDDAAERLWRERRASVVLCACVALAPFLIPIFLAISVVVASCLR